MQDGPKDLFVQILDAVDPDQCGRDETSRSWGGHMMHNLILMFIKIGLNAVGRSLINDRAHIGQQIGWVANLKSIHGAHQHGQEMGGYIRLQIETPQGGATLASGLKGRADDVGDGLFRQGGAVHDHGV